MKQYPLPMLLLVLGACVSPIAQTYPGERKPPAQEAVVLGGNEDGVKTSFSSYKPSTPAGAEAAKWVNFRGYPNELHMLPGRYTLMLYCKKYNAFAFIWIDAQLEAGRRYQAACVNAGDNKVRSRILPL